MQTKGLRIQGHPVHPMLVGLPVTLYLIVLVADVAFLINGSMTWYAVAYVAMGSAIVLALLAAVAGAFEYATIPRRMHAKQTATYHALVNLGVWGLFIVNFVFRSPLGVGIPEQPLEGSVLYSVVFLTILGNALTVTGGWLGAHLVYKHGIGISRQAAETRHITQARILDEDFYGEPPEQRPSSRDEAH